jgi:subtilisin family serine protease
MALIASGAILPSGVRISQGEHHPVVAVKAFDDEGFVSAFDFARSIQFAAAEKAKVMSLSWGSSQDSRFLKDALNYADRLGMIVVAAAGNEPTGAAMYPAAYDTVIGVGALAPSGKRWDSSNFGEHVSLYAPGFAAYDSNNDGISDEAFAGTSVSTAFVSHLIAGILTRRPEATPQQVLEELTAILPSSQ